MKHTFLTVVFVLLGITSCQQKLSEAEATQLVENAKEQVESSQRTLDSINDAVTGASYSSAEEQEKDQKKVKEKEEQLKKAESDLAKAFRTYKESTGKDYMATH